jgi:ribose transport system permease protein
VHPAADASVRPGTRGAASIELRMRVQRFGLPAALVLLMAALTALSPSFLTVGNLLNVMRQVSINAIMAAGMTFVILTGGIDLSVGSILAIAGAVMAGLLKAGSPLLIGLLAGLAVGTGFGAANGAAVAYGNVAPFIATLATLTIARGLTLVYTDGRPISDLGAGFSWPGNGDAFGIPVPALITLLVFAASIMVLTQMVVGRYIYAIGGNEEATRLSGVNVRRYKVLVYALSGFLSAVAAVILTSRLDSAQPTAGLGYELDAIAAVVLGGTTLAGGEGTMLGTLLGAFLIGVLNNGLNLLNVSSFYQQVVKGLVILFAVLLDQKLRGRR